MAVNLMFSLLKIQLLILLMKNVGRTEYEKCYQSCWETLVQGKGTDNKCCQCWQMELYYMQQQVHLACFIMWHFNNLLLGKGFIIHLFSHTCSQYPEKSVFSLLTLLFQLVFWKMDFQTSPNGKRRGNNRQYFHTYRFSLLDHSTLQNH